MVALFLQKGLERYSLLKADVSQLPANPEAEKLKELIASLEPLVLDEASELDTSSFAIDVSKAIVASHSVPTDKGFRRVTKLGKQLEKVAAGVNAICTFLPDEGDEIVDDIQQQLIIVAESLE